MERSADHNAQWFGRIVICLAATVVVAQTIAYRQLVGFFDHWVDYLLLFHGNSAQEYISDFILGNSYYPPLVYTIHFLTWLPAGTNVLCHLLVGNALIIGGAVATYLTLRSLKTPPAAAGLATAGMLLLPGVTVFGRKLIIEQPLMLLIPLCLLLVYRSTGLTRRGVSIGLGICIGLGALTKWAFFFYLLIPLVALVVQAAYGIAARNTSISWKKVAVNAVLCGLAAILVAGWWYFGVLDAAKLAATSANDPTYLEQNIMLHFQHNLTNLRAMISTPVSFFLGAVLILSLVVSKNRWPVIIAAASMAMALLLFSLPSHIENRYVYPLLVFVPYLVATPTDPGWPRKLIHLSSLGFFLLAVLANYYSYVPAAEDSRIDPDAIKQTRLFWGNMKGEEIIHQLANEPIGGDDSKKIVICSHPLWNNFHISDSALHFLALQRSSDLKIEVAPRSKFSYWEFSKELRKFSYDFVLLDCSSKQVCQSGEVGRLQLPQHLLRNEPYIDQESGHIFEPYTSDDVRSDLQFLRTNYRLYKEMELGDGLKIWIYKRPEGATRAPISVR